jgi:iron-sulfur cluster repair protein YtfE (RIC family)
MQDLRVCSERIRGFTWLVARHDGGHVVDHGLVATHIGRRTPMSNARSESAVVHEQPVSLVLELHHRRLDEMLDRVKKAVDIGSWSDARSGFARFQSELETHMRIEEDLMFPSFEAITGTGFGPPAVMRAEHGQIRGLLTSIEGLLRDEQAIDEAAGALETLLPAHNTKEERIVYPMFERHAPGEAYLALDLELKRLTGPVG